MKLFQISQPGTNLPTNASNSPEFANKHLIILALQTQPPFLQKHPFVTLHLTFFQNGGWKKSINLPPQEGEGLVQDLDLVLVPVPTAWLQEQVPQLPQLEKPPLIVLQH